MKTFSNHHGGMRPNAGRPAKYISKSNIIKHYGGKREGAGRKVEHKNETAAAEISATRDKVLKDFLHAYLADTQAAISDVEMVHEMSAEGTKASTLSISRLRRKQAKVI